MREPRRLEIGRVMLRGEDMWFEAAPTNVFEAAPGEPIAVMILFDYKETSELEETTRIKLVAHVDGRELPPATHVHHDRKLAIDDARGFVDVPFAAPARGGESRGRFRLEAHYARKPWETRDAEDVEGWEFSHEGEFVVRAR